MKTIFYKKSEDASGDKWFNTIPYTVWFTLEGHLYEPNGKITASTVIGKFTKRVSMALVEDSLSEEGLIRRIAVYIEP